MATRQSGSKTWRARVSHAGRQIYLGSYPTYEKALEIENNYKEIYAEELRELRRQIRSKAMKQAWARENNYVSRRKSQPES